MTRPATLSPGTRLGPYEILAPIGAGGMGEVYRARDTKLKREIALKILPEVFARDPARMIRFQREVEVLASLNHTNIAHIYGVEERALAMELVEGQTLAGPLPIEPALHYAKQIAEALEYAHERGVIHRDLKPANVKITLEGAASMSVRWMELGAVGFWPTDPGLCLPFPPGEGKWKISTAGGEQPRWRVARSFSSDRDPEKETACEGV